MAKRSLLSMVQGILNVMDGDEVVSISDTAEAQQIARVIEDVYWDLVDEHDLANTKDLFSLEGLADPNKPTHMHLPDNISKVEWIKYDCRLSNDEPKSYQPITYMEPLDFVQLCVSRDSTDTDTFIQVPYTNNIYLTIAKTAPPSYFTLFDDEYVLFDSYFAELDTTMQASKTICYGNIRPNFTSEDDDFTPDLPENLFGTLYSEAMSRCVNNWKQSVAPKIEQSASRMRVRTQRNKWRMDMTHKWPDYGRR
jgi:hypothetical protein